MEPIYLDNNATTRIMPEVVEAVLPYLWENYGNPSSSHRFGEPVKRRIEEARAATATFLGARLSEMVFTGGATESNHTAILGAIALKPSARRIVTTSVEHPSTLLLFRHLERQGYEVLYLPVDPEGLLDMQALEEAVTGETALVSIMWANNETGVIFPVEESARLAKEKGVFFHTDAVQAVGKVPVNVTDVPVDFLTFSGHKIHAPKGIGVLYIRKGIQLPPLLFGHQERGRRGGTENVVGIVGLGKACERIHTDRAETQERIRTLRDRLEEGILRNAPMARVNGDLYARVPNTTNIRFGTCDAEVILNRLNRNGIAASSGSACSSGGTEPSHVLTAMDLPRKDALASIRFSLSRYTTKQEIDRVLTVIPAILEEIGAMETSQLADRSS